MKLEIKARFYATLRDVTETPQTTVDAEGDTVGDVVSALISIYGDRFREEIFHPDGNIKQNVKLLINGLTVDRIAPLQTLVKEGDTLYIFPPIIAG